MLLTSVHRSLDTPLWPIRTWVWRRKSDQSSAHQRHTQPHPSLFLTLSVSTNYKWNLHLLTRFPYSRPRPVRLKPPLLPLYEGILVVVLLSGNIDLPWKKMVRNWSWRSKTSFLSHLRLVNPLMSPSYGQVEGIEEGTDVRGLISFTGEDRPSFLY